MILNERLRILRKQSGKLQNTIALAVGVTVNSLQRFESGLVKPKLDTVIKLADFYNVSIDYLVGRSDNPARL